MGFCLTGAEPGSGALYVYVPPTFSYIGMGQSYIGMNNTSSYFYLAYALSPHSGHFHFIHYFDDFFCFTVLAAERIQSRNVKCVRHTEAPWARSNPLANSGRPCCGVGRNRASYFLLLGSNYFGTDSLQTLWFIDSFDRWSRFNFICSKKCKSVILYTRCLEFGTGGTPAACTAGLTRNILVVNGLIFWSFADIYVDLYTQGHDTIAIFSRTPPPRPFLVHFAPGEKSLFSATPIYGFNGIWFPFHRQTPYVWDPFGDHWDITVWGYDRFGKALHEISDEDS